MISEQSYDSLYSSKRSFVMESLAKNIQHDLNEHVYNATKTADQLTTIISDIYPLSESEKEVFRENFEKRIEIQSKHKKFFEENGIADYFRQTDVQARILDYAVLEIEKAIKEDGLSPNLAYNDFDSMTAFNLSKAIEKETYNSPIIEVVAKVAKSNNLLDPHVQKQWTFGQDVQIDPQMMFFVFNQLADYVTHIMLQGYKSAISQTSEEKDSTTKFPKNGNFIDDIV